MKITIIIEHQNYISYNIIKALTNANYDISIIKTAASDFTLAAVFIS